MFNSDTDVDSDYLEDFLSDVERESDDDSAGMVSDQENEETPPDPPEEREGAIDSPNVSPRIVEIDEEEFPAYFDERDDRLYSVSGTAPYPLPVDTPEQNRQNLQHAILRRLIGANYVGPVPQTLALVPGQQKVVADICTGSGKWMMEMGKEFPHVLFRGVDIVPIATRYPLPNVHFEVADIDDGLRWDNSSVDFVHARSIAMAIRDYRTILPEVVRILKRGGLFMSGEWSRSVTFDPGFELDSSNRAPASTRFYDTLGRVLHATKGIHPTTSFLPTELLQPEQFTEITTRTFAVPIGTWHGDPAMQWLGRAFRAVLIRFTGSVRPILLESGLTSLEVDKLINDFISELRSVRGLIGTYHTVHARKL